MTASDAEVTSTDALSRGVWLCLASIFREPLIGFAIVGAALFGLDALVSEPELPRIVIDAGTVDRIVEERELVLGRAMSGKEREAIVKRLVDSEILAREAVARDLHLSDLKLRESLAARMSFLLEDDIANPTSDDLDQLRKERPDRYMLPKTVTFRHVFFPTSKTAAEAALAEIRAGRLDPKEAGERFWLGRNMERYAAGQLLTVLGAGFVSELRNLPQGEWAGPVRSARGWHVVYLEGFHPSESLTGEELDRRLREDWQVQKQRENREAALENLRTGYVIEVVKPGVVKPDLVEPDVVEPDLASDGERR